MFHASQSGKTVKPAKKPNPATACSGAFNLKMKGAPDRSPSRGPPYWRSTVLRRKSVHERELRCRNDGMRAALIR
jgi:hypothetical protein